MSEVAAALGWKYNHAPGIETRMERDEGTGITAWPVETLGPEPDNTQVAQIVAEYRAHLAQNGPQLNEAEDLADRLQAIEAVLMQKGVMTKQEIDAARPSRPKDPPVTPGPP